MLAAVYLSSVYTAQCATCGTPTHHHWHCTPLCWGMVPVKCSRRHYRKMAEIETFQLKTTQYVDMYVFVFIPAELFLVFGFFKHYFTSFLLLVKVLKVWLSLNNLLRKHLYL